MDKKHSKMEIIKTEGVCVMVFIGIIVLLAAVDLCIKKAIEEQEESSFPKELNEAKLCCTRTTIPGFPLDF